MSALRALRHDRLLTQRELATRAGVQHSAVSQYERGLQPSPRARVLIARALGAPVSKLWPEAS